MLNILKVIEGNLYSNLCCLEAYKNPERFELAIQKKKHPEKEKEKITVN